MPLITMRKAFNRPVYSGQITLAVNTQTITTFPSPEYNQGRKSTVIILGQANNTSEIKWGNPSYEVVILDAQGKTIDTVAAAEYNQVFLPNSKSPFRISFDSIADKRNIAKVEVKIKDAMEK